MSSLFPLFVCVGVWEREGVGGGGEGEGEKESVSRSELLLEKFYSSLTVDIVGVNPI